MDTKIIQITAGRGPAECAAVVARVLSIFRTEAAQQLLECTVAAQTSGHNSGRFTVGLPEGIGQTYCGLPANVDRHDKMDRPVGDQERTQAQKLVHSLCLAGKYTGANL